VDFTFILPEKIIFGEGSISQIGEEANRLGARKALVVTSQGMLKREAMAQVTKSLRKHQMSSEVFSQVEPEPPMDNVHACATFAEEIDCDLLIGLGGGSVMDVAKKVAANLRLPRIMATTTAGTGSEVTHESVLKVDGRKKAFVDEGLVPDVAIIDPNLCRTMPPRLAASSGMDALAHAIECYDSKRANTLIKAVAFQAYTIIKDNLEKAIQGNQQARVNMALGSSLAGIAFGNSGTTLGHALSYSLSNEGIPHGEAVAMMLPYALECNRFDKDITSWVKRIASEFGFHPRFRGDPEEMARVVMEDTKHLSNNPVAVTLEDIVDIFQRARK
jgi:alcohol dehydrogenase class IV